MAGDVVGGYDHTLKKFAWGVVKATKKSIKRGLVSLFAAGTLIAQPTLEHPIWTESHHDYVPAQDLKVGDTFLDGKGATLRLDSLAIKPDTTLTVYNFEVNDFYNYYVGTQEVLVHNTCATLENLAGKLSPPLSVDAAQTLIRDFENSFVRSGIPRLDRTNFYEQILDNLNKNKLSTADVNTLLSEFNSSAISADIKKYLTKNASKGSFDAWLTIKTWTHKSDVYDLLRSGKLNLRGNSYSVKKVGNDLEIYHQDGSKIATISKTEITATSTNGSGNITDMNQVLNVYPHLKNYTIKVDNDRFIYKTDNQGRVKSFTDSDYQLVANKPRSGEQQIAKDIKNGNTGTPPDDGGHMSSTESGGLCEQLNYYPMNPLINRSGGLWRENVERVLKAARQNPANAGKKIEYTVIPTFSSVHIGRPDILNVIWKVDGISQTPISVPNPY